MSKPYFQSLDHVRAICAFLVFCWHFGFDKTHFPMVPLFSFVGEGHVGVAGFMVLSGYLFTKLLDGKNIDFARFLYNRVLRLFPLLIVLMIVNFGIIYFQGGPLKSYLFDLLKGFYAHSWPSGGWSIAVELHFYIVLPLMLFFLRNKPYLLILSLCGAVLLRYGIYHFRGQVQTGAYWYIIGRYDQFVIGMFAAKFAQSLCKQKFLLFFVALCFVLYYSWFDFTGGFSNRPTYPSPSPIWIVHTTIEGIGWASFIVIYSVICSPRENIVTKFLTIAGRYSYSIYLWHNFFIAGCLMVFSHFFGVVHNFYLNFALMLISFVMFVPIAGLSYKFIELPFLNFRKNYIKNNE